MLDDTCFLFLVDANNFLKILYDIKHNAATMVASVPSLVFACSFPEIDMEGTIAPDTDPPQQMGDSSIEVCMLCYNWFCTMLKFDWLLCC